MLLEDEMARGWTKAEMKVRRAPPLGRDGAAGLAPAAVCTTTCTTITPPALLGGCCIEWQS